MEAMCASVKYPTGRHPNPSVFRSQLASSAAGRAGLHRTDFLLRASHDCDILLGEDRQVEAALESANCRHHHNYVYLH